MEVNIKTKIEREVLENIFVGALEGGSNYWYYITDREYNKIRQAVPKSEEEAFSMAMFKAIFDKGVEVFINDAENPEEELGMLSYPIISQRLNRLASNPHYAKFLTAEIEGNGDADTSDAIFQLLTMNDIVFG
jgi:hypothetical protein